MNDQITALRKAERSRIFKENLGLALMVLAAWAVTLQLILKVYSRGLALEPIYHFATLGLWVCLGIAGGLLAYRYRPSRDRDTLDQLQGGKLLTTFRRSLSKSTISVMLFVALVIPLHTLALPDKSPTLGIILSIVFFVVFALQVLLEQRIPPRLQHQLNQTLSAPLNHNQWALCTAVLAFSALAVLSPWYPRLGSSLIPLALWTTLFVTRLRLSHHLQKQSHAHVATLTANA